MARGSTATLEKAISDKRAGCREPKGEPVYIEVICILSEKHRRDLRVERYVEVWTKVLDSISPQAGCVGDLYTFDFETKRKKGEGVFLYGSFFWE